MRAQTLYGLNHQMGFCSGDDMHSFFERMCDGEPSPSGRAEIDTDQARAFIRERLEHMARHNGGDLAGLYSADELCRLMEV